jgi:hypothetical protein
MLYLLMGVGFVTVVGVIVIAIIETRSEKETSQIPAQSKPETVTDIASLVGFFATLGQGIAILMVVFSFYMKDFNWSEKTSALQSFYHFFIGWGYVLFPLGFMLKKHSRMAFYGGLIFFSLSILKACQTMISLLIVSEGISSVVIAGCIVFILVNAIFMYGIIAARKLFLR